MERTAGQFDHKGTKTQRKALSHGGYGERKRPKTIPQISLIVPNVLYGRTACARCI
jgi:hypothetical protein